MMTRLSCCFFALGLAAGPVWAAGQGGPDGPLGLSEFAQLDFLDASRGMLRVMEDAPEDRSNLMDLAALHLSHGMIDEGAGVLAALDPRRVDGDAAVRLAVLQATAGLLSRTGPDPRAIDETQSWPEGAAIRAHALWQGGGAATVGQPELKALAAMPPALRAMVLPSLLEIAIAARDWETGVTLAAQFDDHVELSGSPFYWLSLGRVAEARDQPVTAFEGYLHASRGADAHAHAARVALVRLGLDTETMTPEEARAQLEVLRWAWRGDGAARDGLTLLADVAERQKDAAGALSALAQIARDARDRDARAMAQSRAAHLLKQLYAPEALAGMPLADLLRTHGAVTSDWQFDPVYHHSAMAVPSLLLDRGMSVAAAREAFALREIVVVSADLGLAPQDQRLEQELSLIEARAYMTGERFTDAVRALQDIAPDQRTDDIRALLAEAAIRAGLPAEPGTNVDPMRLSAERAFGNQDWLAAHDRYLALFDRQEFEFRDAVRLMIAAHRIGRSDTLNRLIAEIPRLTDLPQWAEIAATLTPRPEGVAPPPVLTRNAALTAVRRAGELQDASRAVGGAAAE